MKTTTDGSSGSVLPEDTLSLEQILILLQHADTSARMDVRLNIIAAVYTCTHGSEESLAAAQAWGAIGASSLPPTLISSYWRGWRQNPPTANLDTLTSHLETYGVDWQALLSINRPVANLEATSEADPETPAKPPPALLLRFSLIDELPALKSDVVEQTQLCSGLALLGQSTVWNAEPNTGKTAIALWSIIREIQQGTIDPARTFYFNLDDSLLGLIEKTEIAQQHGFHVISEGYRGFRATDFEAVIQELIDADQCHGVIILIDVLKAVVDVMDKGRSSSFGKLIRRFILRGGTCVALAHTNKRRNSAGEPIYAGTSDIREDFNCAYIMYETNIDPDSQTKTILFKNQKSRGNVRKQVSFQYSVREGLSYTELLESITEVSEADLLVAERQKQLQSDLTHIEVIRDAIRSDINTKMALAALLVEKTNCSKRTAIRVIEQYEGADPETHFWTFEVGPRGAKMYRLLGQ
jgi:hypothetical protein